jgi:hypothetical protein
MNVPRRPRPRKEPGSSNGGTALALLALLLVAGGLFGLGMLILPDLFFFPVVVFGLFCFGAIHYLLWGWWLKSLPPEEEDEE